jgi:hypothetical protein
MKMPCWFSAMAVFVIWVGGEPDAQVVRSLYLLRAGGFDAAFEKAVARAREGEAEYVNVDGELVRWLLAGVESLVCLGRGVRGSARVFSEFGRSRSVSDFVFPLRPELSEPGCSGV